MELNHQVMASYIGINRMSCIIAIATGPHSTQPVLCEYFFHLKQAGKAPSYAMYMISGTHDM